MSGLVFNTVPQLIEAIGAGQMVVITDDEHNGEGSLLMAAEQAGAEAVTFMAVQARGLICLALTEQRCRALGLDLMVPNSRAQHGVGFTRSIEAATGVSTGISAADRARSIQVAVDPASVPADLVQPGHIFPVQALPGGVMQRAGHVEAACDLTRLAGRQPAATLVGILNEDGELARGAELHEFAQRHDLRIGTIADLIHYRILHEGTIERGGEYPLQTRHGEFQVTTYQDTYQGALHLALVKGRIDSTQPVLVRVQSIETLRDVLGCESEGGTQQWTLERSLASIAAAGNGVLVLLAQKETADGVLEQLRQRSGAKPRTPQFPQRTLGIGAQILRDQNVRKMRLMSSPVPYKAVSGFDLEVTEFVPFQPVV
ncbi:3,4-dihydroxy-2-butanone-4-phosphate synthase [Pseudomonas sp. UW4]|uniref:3,4-dihydroxy-2-butanone-4-phosphate synthase n=1 Tax=Pseudomonas sp. UW4 TaxID=1207075 RepID=UPI00029D01A5|nr:3,4-dihydroxy-2-butanone-4-phosphate synthase [Pseudomonas sp. UW4]AFY18874.1 bifunctional 3,4-dihydroxy-2-butanone 4-phosphate synthase/GTP cyclohydrolase II [Pseudomonas sp. UW4]